MEQAPSTTSQDSWRKSLERALLADRTACDRRVTVIQLILIWISHPVIALIGAGLSEISAYALSNFLSRIGGGPWITYSSEPTWSFEREDLIALPAVVAIMLALSLIAMVGEGALAWIPYRIAARSPQHPFRVFVRSWWRTCTLAYLCVPLFMFVAAAVSDVALESGTAVLVLACAILGPAYFAKHDRRKMSRWRPCCPECGYSLRKLVSPRCPECGVSFPTEARTFRRWATRRLIWERVHRGGFAFAYIKAVLSILVRPAAAARGLAIPDRFPRAIRWAMVHIALAALAGLSLSSDGYFTSWIYAWFIESPWPELRQDWAPGGGSIAWWATQSLLAWMVSLAVFPLVGVLLAYAAPGRRFAAKRGVAKWSLYASLLLVPAFVLLIASHFVFWRSSFATAPIGFPTHVDPELFFAPFALIYGVWWAVGVAANAYLQRRGLAVFVINAALYFVSWIAITRLLFSPGALGVLL